MVEFLFTFLLFASIIFLTLQFTLIANVRSMLNLATYSAAREYAVTYSSDKAQAAGQVYMAPFTLEGEALTYFSIPSDPGFGGMVTVKGKALYHLQMPLTRGYFGIYGKVGVVPITSQCTMTME